jgi:serine/threonine protein kinase
MDAECSSLLAASVSFVAQVLYQMLTGCLPLSKGTGPDMQDNLQLVHAILTQVPPTPAQLRPASIPLVLSHIIMKCIEKNPDDRYQSAFGLSVDLRSCLQLTQSLAAPPPGSLSFPLPLFQLGVWDQAAVFAVSKKLYGCSEAVSTLQRALESMLATRKTHVVAIRGSPGSVSHHTHTRRQRKDRGSGRSVRDSPLTLASHTCPNGCVCL